MMQEQRTIGSERLKLVVGGAQATALSFDGLEVVRGISAPVRDENWATLDFAVQSEVLSPSSYLCHFLGSQGLFAGTFRVELDDDTCTAEAVLTFAKSAVLNRAGFCLLHPIAGVAGSPLVIRHPDESETTTVFPALISPAQPAQNIAGLSHRIGDVKVDIWFEGDVFEMEDQRNWSDASFKTYCRPLGLPRPFTVAEGEVVKQKVTVRLSGHPAPRRTEQVAPLVVEMPQVMLAFGAGESSLSSLSIFPDLPVLARINTSTDDSTLVALAARPSVALELVVDELEEIDLLAQRCAAAGLSPVRVVALPRPYLQSHQVEGPWPPGASPTDCMRTARRAFPDAQVGGGSLTNFAEFNRCRPSLDADFTTFGNTAIVHAADDFSVCQTLEAIPDIFASAQSIGAGKPLHLGLFSIGMRSNPYGADVVPNPEARRIAMAGYDPRQDLEFAGAYALAVLTLAAAAGVQSIALSMPDGPLGAVGRPIARVLRLAHGLAGRKAAVEAREGVFRVRCDGIEAVASLPARPVSANNMALCAATLHIQGEAA